MVTILGKSLQPQPSICLWPVLFRLAKFANKAKAYPNGLAYCENFNEKLTHYRRPEFVSQYLRRNDVRPLKKVINSECDSRDHIRNRGILKGEVSLYN